MSRLFPLRLIPDKTQINFMGLKNYNFAFSILITLLSLFFFFTKGFNLGIDFQGGVIIEVQFNQPPNITDLKKHLHQAKLPEVIIQNFDEKNFTIKVAGRNTGNLVSTNKIAEEIKGILQQHYVKDGLEFRKIDYVGPQVGSKLAWNAITAITLSFFGIMLYVAYRFQWQFALGVLLALVHDAIISLGMISATGLEFNLNSVAAILTVIGYSVNDSVVIYDRIRENIKKYKKITLTELINLSTNETLSRTILTVLTTLIAALSLVIFGGPELYSFSIVVFFGIIMGTYSSIYISAPIIIHFGLNDIKRI